MGHARFDCSPRPSYYDHSPNCPAGRITFGNRGIRSHQTSTVNPESLPLPCTQSPTLGSADRRFVFAVDSAEPPLAIDDRIQTIDSVEFPSRPGVRLSPRTPPALILYICPATVPNRRRIDVQSVGRDYCQ